MSDRRDRSTVIREAHLGARQLLDWLDEYDRDSGGAMVGVQAWAPDLYDQIRPIYDAIREAAERLEVELYDAKRDEVPVTGIDAVRERRKEAR